MIVMKFGGASVAHPKRFSQVASLIAERKKRDSKIVVVVSAMAKTTQSLHRLMRKVHPSPPRREQDMMISVGERISIALLAAALSLQNQPAVSFTGSQAGIITCEHHSEAKILEVRPHRVLSAMDAGNIAIVAGFQGVSLSGQITTLGSNGSDVSAVALGVALGAHQVEFYKDVGGVFDRDPKQFSQARCFPFLSYEQALLIAKQGSVLHPRSLELAKKNGMPLWVRSFQALHEEGTRIGEETACASIPVYEEETCALS